MDETMRQMDEYDDMKLCSGKGLSDGVESVGQMHTEENHIMLTNTKVK